MQPLLSIRTKLFLSILLVLVVSYATLIFTTVKSVYSTLEDKIDHDLSDDLRYARSQYLARAELMKYNLMQPASVEAVRRRVRDHERRHLKRSIERWHSILPFAEVITVFDAQGRAIARLGSDLSGDRLLFPTELIDYALKSRQPAISTELVSDAFIQREVGQVRGELLVDNRAMMVTVVVPMVEPNGTVVGGILAGDIINRDPHLPFQVQEIFGKGVEVTVTQGGERIASSMAEDAPHPATVSLEVMEKLVQLQPYRGEAEIGRRSYETIFTPITNFHGDLIGSLSVALSKADLNKIKHDNLRNIVTSIVIGVVFSFLLAFLVARRLSRPLLLLTRSVQQVEAGELNQQVHVTSRDEFGMLGDSFNRMARALAERERTISSKTSALEKLNQELEVRVAERTAALRKEMGMLEAILTSMVEGVVVTDRENRVILFNPAAQKLFDLVPHRVLHHPIADVCGDGGFCQLLEEMGRLPHGAADTAVSAEAELAVKGKKLRASISELLDEQGEYEGVVMSIRDVTAEEEVDRMKNEFISTVSHELKTPLTSMKGSLQFILSKAKWLTGTERELLAVCQRNTDRLIRLINDILDISRIESGGIAFSFRQVSIVELVLHAIEEIRGFAIGRQISIITSVGGDLPQVYGDQDRLMQVLTNLLSNAIKFSPMGKAITVSASREGNYVSVAVADKGPSIQWSDRDKLFKKFQRMGGADSREHGGTGLGLAICKEIIEHHHGKIFYESGPAGGNVFTFTVPVSEER